jgi:hypothetical protein
MTDRCFVLGLNPDKWQHQDDGALLIYALSFLDVTTLLQKEIVN